MKRMSEKRAIKKHKLTRKQRKFILISAIILILIAIIFGITKLIKTLSPVDNITKETINIQFSTKEIINSDIKITLSTTTKYDIYYYIDYKNEETAEDIFVSENIVNTTSQNNTIDTNQSTTNTILSNSKLSNSLYKKYENNIIVSNNATVYLKYAKGNKFCNSAYSFEINNIDKQGPSIGEIDCTATNNSIEVKVSAKDNHSSKLTYYFRLENDNEFICTDNTNQYTFENLEKNKTYTIYIKVLDELGNESEAVTDCQSSIQEVATQKSTYYIKVNILANTVTVYAQDENGEYTKPVKAMICSCGKATPKNGVYNISYKYRWLALFGNVYGQYSTRIVGHILFHSVPYLSTDPNTLEYEEYDKLGTTASAGCIRLTVKDAKWIYDNVASGSQVEFYSDSNPGPLGKPTAQKISNNQFRDWDPTDPDSRNPWLGGNGEVISNHPTIDKEDNDDNNIDNEISNNTTNTIDNSVQNDISNNTINGNTTNNIQNSTNETSNETISNTISNEVVNSTSNTVNNNTISNTTNEVVNNTIQDPENGSDSSTNEIVNNTVQEPMLENNI